MVDREIEGFFIEDERKYRKEDIAKLIDKLKKYAKLIGKQGRVHVEDRTLSGTKQSKIFLIARYLGSELAKLKPELGIKQDISSASIKEFAEFLSIDNANARARIAQLINEGFAKRPTTGTVQVEPFQIERFLDQLEGKGEVKVKVKTKRTVRQKKQISQKRIQEKEIFDEKTVIDNIAKFVSAEKTRIKDSLYLGSDRGDFKFHHMLGESKTEKQKNCILSSGYIYLFGLNKKTFKSNDLINICRNSGIDPEGLKFTLIAMKKQSLIGKTGSYSQENILREKGKKEAKKILEELFK